MQTIRKEYYYIDLRVTDMKVTTWGVSGTATLTGETDDQNVHRIFLPKGQYHKMIAVLNQK